MKLYVFLQTRVPAPAAIVVTALWFALLIFLAIFFAGERLRDRESLLEVCRVL